ncbi:MAG: DUF86 domain-containing protein [Muribaculaceae bacterium]|nr:DUF86 domain-containing protein [Muribaculaceae bacterium]
MDERTEKYLSDILAAIIEVTEETDLRGRKFEALCSDRVYLRFIERNIGIIGEAMNQVLKRFPEVEITSARQIVNTRNLVIHSYDSLDKEILWAIVIKHLPVLKKEVIQLLNQ